MLLRPLNILVSDVKCHFYLQIHHVSNALEELAAFKYFVVQHVPQVWSLTLHLVQLKLKCIWGRSR